MSPAENARASEFEATTPILRVQDIAASILYYVQQLGFHINWQTLYFASVSRGRCTISLSQGDQGYSGVWVWIGVSDADALLEEYRRSGAKIRHQPTNYSWAYEMQVEDLDGNVLRLGSEPKKNTPTGEWLDMNGARWVQSPNQEWRRADSQ
jgi:predicted enzyme related to lactoylglutathione lyase